MTHPYPYTLPLTSNPPGIEFLANLGWGRRGYVISIISRKRMELTYPYPTPTQIGQKLEPRWVTCKWQCVGVGVCHLIGIGSV
jgi:hypothetical protein